MNAYNKHWTLSINRPYADWGTENSTRESANGQPIFENGFKVPGYTTEMTFDGTLNDGQQDKSWTMEMMIPIKPIIENNQTGNVKPGQGVYWRT